MPTEAGSAATERASPATSNAPPHRGRFLVPYASLVALGAALYLGIWLAGPSASPAKPAPPPEAAPPFRLTALAHVLLALAGITLLARFAGGAFKTYLRQPAVIGEIVAGLVLGPSVLGALFPAASGFLLPGHTAAALETVAKVGVVIFMFLVGLELDARSLRGTSGATLFVSHASVIAPFLLGALLALFLHEGHAGTGVSFGVFSLFVGLAFSVTAFPVLARILQDRGEQRTPLGSTALACAAVVDVTAWTLLAFVAGAAVAGGLSSALVTVGLLAAYALLMLAGARPLLERFARREEEKSGPLSRTALAVVCVAFLGSAFATEAIGVHALFGAFFIGAILESDGRLAREIRAKLEDAVVVLLLPSFFVLTGLRTEVGLLESATDWLVLAAIVLLATLGKVGGTFAAARLRGFPPRDAAALGVLLNARGLMELVALNLGLELGIIGPKLFTMLVLMALVTTFLTTPMLDAILGRRGFGNAGASVSPDA